MFDDPIVAEVRKVKEELAAKFDFDIDRIFADLMERQKANGDRLVDRRNIAVTNEEVGASEPAAS